MQSTVVLRGAGSEFQTLFVRISASMVLRLSFCALFRRWLWTIAGNQAR